MVTIGLRGLGLAECQIIPFPIDFDGRPYNTLALLYECVMLHCVAQCTGDEQMVS